VNPSLSVYHMPTLSADSPGTLVFCEVSYVLVFVGTPQARVSNESGIGKIMIFSLYMSISPK